MNTLRGGCFCGAVRYEADAVPYHLTNCHCSICRRTTGAPFVAWFSVPRAAFRFVHGTPKTFRSSANAQRSFCPACGSQLTFASDQAPGEIDVTTCTLDDPGRVPPEDHTYFADKVAWVETGDGLPRHEGARPEE
jgi:hypothetical protein